MSRSTKPIDWEARAKQALRVDGTIQSSGDSEHFRLMRGWVPHVAAALAEAYGEGKGEGRADPCARCELVRKMGPLADH